jgi:hypothetical protein
MAERKPTIVKTPERPDLDALVHQARSRPFTDADFQEQRVSFAYGNAPNSVTLTKDDIRRVMSTFCIAAA